MVRVTQVSMPATITLAAVAAMAEADRVHRYELTPDGALIVTPPPVPDHNRVVAALTIWLGSHGFSADRLLAGSGVLVGSGTGGRIPDLMVVDDDDVQGADGGVWIDPEHVLLVVEVTSPSTVADDRSRKVMEYAAAGIPHYWIVEVDRADWRRSAVRQLSCVDRFDPRGYRQARPDPISMAALLATTPAQHGLGQP
jgi:Uma2 family endonuclease